MLPNPDFHHADTMTPASLPLLEQFDTNFVSPSRVAGIEDINNNSISGIDEDISELPNWIDPKLLREGQEFIRRNFFSVFVAHFISLIFLLCYTPVRLILVRTGRSNTTTKALKRYFATLVHIKGWYEADLLQPLDDVNDDIARIRILHSRLARSLTNWHSTYKDMNPEVAVKRDQELLDAIRSDFSSPKVVRGSVDGNELSPPISQLDMCVTQFCFMGVLSLFPKSFGIFETTGMEGYVHIWAVIGRRLGIQDQFNICLKKNHYTHALILNQIIVPEIAKCGTSTLMLWTSLTSGISKFVPFISIRAILLFILRNILALPGLKLASILTVYDLLCYKLMQRCFQRWILNCVVRNFLNNLLRLAIVLTVHIRFPNIMHKNNANGSQH